MANGKLRGVDSAVADTPRETFFGKGPNGWDGEEENRKVEEAIERYNKEGLANLESVLCLSASGKEHKRIDTIAAEVERRVCNWQKTSPSALMKDHDAIQALFVVTEKVAMSSYLNDGMLPDCWWARLALRLDERGLYDALIKQIHRETHARAAREFLRDERGMGGRAKAAKAKPNPERAQAVEYASSHAGLSAVQIKTRLGLRASERTIRGWLSATY